LRQKLNDGNDLKLVEIQTQVMKDIFKFELLAKIILLLGFLGVLEKS